MTLLKTDRLWLRSLKWSLAFSLPIFLLMVVDVVFLFDERGNVMPTILYYLGTLIYVLQWYIFDKEPGNFFDVTCAWSCLANSLVIWLAVYVVLRIRINRAEKRACSKGDAL